MIEFGRRWYTFTEVDRSYHKQTGVDIGRTKLTLMDIYHVDKVDKIWHTLKQANKSWHKVTEVERNL